MPSVLLITAEYPPGPPVGYERITKFEKYLPDFGFHTCVLTTQSHGRSPSDISKHVYRAFEPGQLYRPLARHLLKSTQPSTLGSHAEQRTAQRRGVFEGTILDSARHWILDQLAIPDLYITWLPGALLLGLKVMRIEQVDIILSSSPPETVHLVAVCLAAVTNKPWVADFRDGWLFEPLKPILRRDNLRRRVEARLEHLVVSAADAVVSVSQPMTDYFHDTYPASCGKFHTITNGYDPDDWRDITPPSYASSKLRIVHTGAFLRSRSESTRDLKPFLRALKALEPGLREKIEVLLVGELTEQEKGYLDAIGLGDTVRVVGWVSKRESLAYQLSADLLLLIVGSDKSVATSKLYEYLYAGRPILALSAMDTAAAAIIRQTQSGYVVDPADVKAIVDHLTHLFGCWRKGELDVQPVDHERYSRQHLTQQLAEVLNRAIAEVPAIPDTGSQRTLERH